MESRIMNRLFMGLVHNCGSHAFAQDANLWRT